MEQTTVPTYYKREFWCKENLKYAQPHFRLEKSARLVNRIAQGRPCDLLDVGCGPATVMRLLDRNIRYYGIDIAIHEPAAHLRQIDFVEGAIGFEDKRFGIVLAQGVFEYIGALQAQKFSEITKILTDTGKFVVSYVNFDHIKSCRYSVYNNMQPFKEFKKSVSRFFTIDRIVPTSHRWRHREPERRIMKDIQMHINADIPVVSPMFAVEYFLICSPRSPERCGA
jgi:SAM-dependent methyltransferase